MSNTGRKVSLYHLISRQKPPLFLTYAEVAEHANWFKPFTCRLAGEYRSKPIRNLSAVSGFLSLKRLSAASVPFTVFMFLLIIIENLSDVNRIRVNCAAESVVSDHRGEILYFQSVNRF